MTAPIDKKGLRFSDLLRFDVWRYLFKAIWLFFPAIIFLWASYACFWKLTQGKDLMVITLENRNVFLYFIIALLYWVYITWYSSRLVAKAKEFEQPCDDHIWTMMRVHGPRLLGFISIAVIMLAFFRLPEEMGIPRLSKLACTLIFLAFIPIYFILYKVWDSFLEKQNRGQKKKKRLIFIQTVTWVFLGILVVVVVFFKIFAGLIILLLVMQQALLVLLIIRRKLIDDKGQAYYQKADKNRGFSQTSSTPVRIKGLLLDEEDRYYFRFFLIVSVVAFAIYLGTVFSVKFAVTIGSFPFVFVAFGVLLLLGNTVAFFSVLKHFNFHILLLGLAFVIGLIFEPHYTELPDKKNVTASFKQRQDLREYFINWVNDTNRKKILDNPAVTSYPVFFVLANGGASRSGYWVASVLGTLQDVSDEKFSNHLLCLSGASGGSVGTASFFSLLRARDKLIQQDTTGTPYISAVHEYLSSDFLTFTLARMLGPDVFRHIFPLRRVDDRAAALAHSLEKASGKKSFLYDSMAVGYSDFITQKGQPDYKLPILCVNTTRMQDGSPAVISNIAFQDRSFNRRIDVLNLLDEKKDLSLSAAVVLGASFPYVSPAGRIDTDVTIIKKDGSEKQVKEPNYFVDGGYFDNSGAGIVNEMIIYLRSLLAYDTAVTEYASKIKFYVLHISNDPVGNHVLEKVNPLINDLAAPLKTLTGAYSSQTAVNDERLRNYLRGFYRSDSHYININLYKPKEEIHFSMNWVISDYLLKAMNSRLHSHKGILTVLEMLKNY